MTLGVLLVLLAAAIPFIYYAIALFSAWRYFRSERISAQPDHAQHPSYTPPVSILKPIRGLDREAYENFLSFCRQDYSEYEILFCVDGPQDAAVPHIERLRNEFPERPIRVLFGSGRNSPNDKVAKLARLVKEARYETVVISDSDVRVRPEYLRILTAGLRDEGVGAATCFYASIGNRSFTGDLHTVGMLSDFYAGILTAWQLDGVKFTLGPTIATTRAHLERFGGYGAIENRPADDLLVGRLIAEQGYTVKLLPYVIGVVADFESPGDLFHKRLRWTVVMRCMRPWGHLGLLLTQGLPWSIAAFATHPSAGVGLGYFGTYCVLRAAMTWLIGVHGLKQRGVWKRMPLIPVWDAAAFLIWVASFFRRSIRWRGANYTIEDGYLKPVRVEP